MTTVNLNQNFLSGHGQVGLDITPPATQPDVLAAFANNSALPFRQIDLGSITAKASAGVDKIAFGDGVGQVSFTGSASAFAGLGVYPDPDKLLTDLKLEGDLAKGMNLPSDQNTLYLALRWGYDLAASAKGSLALGAPVTFSGSAKREALYAVIRRLSKTTGAVTAVEQTVQSWMMPKQITTIDNLEPGTWLIAEVDGSIAGSLGIKYGYNFNWVHEAQLMGLSGDIALNLKLGVQAALGFNLSSSFGLVVSRDSTDRLLRFRLFRLKRKGWNFEFDAGASVQGDVNNFLPEYDEFVKAVFGVHGGQVLKDLEIVRKWTDPEVSLGELLSGEGVTYAEDFFEKVTGLDPKTAFDAVKDRLTDFLDHWNNLPHQVSSTIWRFVEKQVDLTEVRNLAQQIADANADTFKKLIAPFIADVEFLPSPAGEWLEKAAGKGLMEVLNSSHEFHELQKVAQKTVELLDEDKLESVLKNLQDYVVKHLNLNSLFPGFNSLKDIIGAGSLQDLDQASFATLDKWLKARLASFIDKEIDELNLGDINKIRQSIFLFMNKAQSFYEKTLKALNSKYEFNLSFTYQSTTTNTALLDFTLDFNQDGVIDGLHEALDGKYDQLLVSKRNGITLNLGRLSHQIQRHSHVELNLPWQKKTLDHINESMAKVDAVDNDNHRLFIYELDSKDIVEEKNKRQSRLAIGGYFKVPLNQVRVHDEDEITYSYTFRQAKKQMKRAEVQYQLKPYANTYLKSAFAQSPAGGFDEWVNDLDQRIDELDDNGKKVFGDTLVGLNLSLPGAVAAGWLSAPPKAEHGPKVPVYLNMSRALQRRLKQIIPFYYFANLENFSNNPLPAKVLLVYSAMPVSTTVKLDGNELTLDTDKDYYWDFVDQTLRRAMVGSMRTRTNLSVILERVHNLLMEAGMTGTADSFSPDQAEVIQNAVIHDDASSGRLFSLLFTENDIIKGAREAGYAIAKFTAGNDQKPTEAVKALATFGSKLSETFNAKITSIYGGSALRPLGTALFTEAASMLDSNAAIVAAQLTAMLDVTVLRHDAEFALATYLDGKVPEKKEIVIHERILNV